MKTKLKKLSLAVVSASIGLLVSTFAWATPSVDIIVSGTTYNFSYIYGAFNDSATATILKSQPWWTGSNDDASARTFALALGNAGDYVLGKPNINPNNITGYPDAAPFFSFDNYNNQYNHVVYQINNGSPAVQVATSSPGPLSQSFYYAVATPVGSGAVAPEIDGALIPQVVLVLAGLFLILGRRKESTEPLFAV